MAKSGNTILFFCLFTVLVALCGFHQSHDWAVPWKHLARDVHVSMATLYFVVSLTENLPNSYGFILRVFPSFGASASSVPVHGHSRQMPKLALNGEDFPGSLSSTTFHFLNKKQEGNIASHIHSSMAKQEINPRVAAAIPENELSLKKGKLRKNLKDTLTHNTEEMFKIFAIKQQTRREGGEKDLKNKNLLEKYLWLFVTLCTVLLLTFRMFDRDAPPTNSKVLSNLGREDLLVELSSESRLALGVKDWRSTDSALWRFLLSPFERLCCDLESLLRLSHNFLPATQTLRVAPASQFLPTVLGNEGNRFQYIGYRLASLAALPSGCPISPLRLAEGGYHYNPDINKSAVICHECGATYSWGSPSATRISPLLYHQTLSPTCSVVQSRSGIQTSTSTGMLTTVAGQLQRQLSDDVQTDGAAEAPPAARAASITRSGADEQRTSHMAAVTDCPDGYTLALPNTSEDVQSSAGAMAVSSASASSGSGEKVLLDLNSAVYPLYSSLQSRLTTFSKWPAANFRPPEVLAPMGFFYAGYADCVRCFYCGIGLKTWEENDDPEEEHIRWRPNCQFVLATKGKRFVDNTLARLNRRMNPDDEVPDTPNPARDSQRGAPPSGENLTREGGSNRSTTLSSDDRQQLLQMGFSADMIRSAQENLLRAGQTLNIDNILGFLVP
ncbi:baculoviral IAP repeat-containing protein 2-like [Pomacea canaliculata]|uniref:baculoviral IAP repeat-containing protein 2-like n=1 Tax=Pomacea canaliculata TaxID=400727 RepID=UPI000D72D929|nr:baculoviral IAP repeat-containing protein 2-like [Pomacea canaliculata]XP_025098181.1 baculoviral IAP repeat-containing protein 2-like [Pomacea canaliculata]